MTAAEAKKEGTDRLIDTVEHAEHTSLEAVRKFLDTVEGIFPHLRDDEPRSKIIDSAFEMTEQLVASATRLAQNILDVTQKARSESDRKSAASSRKAATPTKAAKVTRSAKKATKKATATRKAAKATKSAPSAKKAAKKATR